MDLRDSTVSTQNSLTNQDLDAASVTLRTTVLSGGPPRRLLPSRNSGSYRLGNGWHVDSRSSANHDTNLVVYAYCLAGGSSN